MHFYPPPTPARISANAAADELHKPNQHERHHRRRHHASDSMGRSRLLHGTAQRQPAASATTTPTTPAGSTPTPLSLPTPLTQPWAPNIRACASHSDTHAFAYIDAIPPSPSLKGRRQTTGPVAHTPRPPPPDADQRPNPIQALTTIHDASCGRGIVYALRGTTPTLAEGCAPPPPDGPWCKPSTHRRGARLNTPTHLTPLRRYAVPHRARPSLTPPPGAVQGLWNAAAFRRATLVVIHLGQGPAQHTQTPAQSNCDTPRPTTPTLTRTPQTLRHHVSTQPPPIRG